MTVAPYPEFFNDVFGPVMQPGSSSHTAGPCRLGRLAADLLGEPLKKVRIELDEQGSFAGTFGIMAEDRAMVAGVLGYLPDDPALFRSFELAEEAGVEVEFAFTHITASDHPNAIRFVLTGRDGLMVDMVGQLDRRRHGGDGGAGRLPGADDRRQLRAAGAGPAREADGGGPGARRGRAAGGALGPGRAAPRDAASCTCTSCPWSPTSAASARPSAPRRRLCASRCCVRCCPSSPRATASRSCSTP